MEYAQMMEKLAILAGVIAFCLLLTSFAVQTKKIVQNMHHQMCIIDQRCNEEDTQ